MATSNKRPLAVLNIKLLRKINDFIAKMRGISLNMANNVAVFTTPSPSLATFNTNIDALEDAEAVVKTGVRGSVEDRNKKYDLVLDNVHSEMNYVQDLADAAADVDDALAIIAKSGFDIKGHSARLKPDFTAVNLEVSGTVELVAKAAARRSSNEWKMSTDRIAWTMLPSSLQAKTIITGLTTGTTVYFMHRPILKNGVGQWSQIVELVVT